MSTQREHFDNFSPETKTEEAEDRLETEYRNEIQMLASKKYFTDKDILEKHPEYKEWTESDMMTEWVVGEDELAEKAGKIFDHENGKDIRDLARSEDYEKAAEELLKLLKEDSG